MHLALLQWTPLIHSLNSRLGPTSGAATARVLEVLKQGLLLVALQHIGLIVH